jgi:hypothetical protein
MIERFCENIIAARQFTAFKPANDPVYFEVRDHRFFRIQKNIAWKPLVTLLQALSFNPFPLDDFGRYAPNAISILNDESNVLALLRFAKETISVHESFYPFRSVSIHEYLD